MEPIQDNQQRGGGGSGVGGYILVIFMILCMVAAGVLSWMANANELTGMRVIYTISSFASGPFYLVYYVVMRRMLGYEYSLYTKIK